MALRDAARVMRESGERVILIMSAQGDAKSTDVAYDPVADNSAIDYSTAVKKPVYGHIKWHDLGDIKYEAGGKATMSKADIEFSAAWTPYLKTTVAVQLEDGSLLRKCAEKLGETKAIYTLVVEGYIGNNDGY